VKQEYIKRTKKAKYLDISDSDEPIKYNLSTKISSNLAHGHFLLSEASEG
jgi:hypothetical protein